MNQSELLQTINTYNNTKRSIIKTNLKRVMRLYRFKSADVMQLGYARHNVYSWGNSRANNIPMFDQALTIGVNFNFDVREFLKVV